MANKILPDEIKAELRRLSVKRRRKAPLDDATRQLFVEWGKKGQQKAKAKLTRDVLQAAGKKGGEAWLQKICAKYGVDYHSLPDAVNP